MKKITLLASALLLIFAVVSIAQTVPADKTRVDLKTEWGVQGSQKAVFFDHTKHVAKLKCENCHDSATGGSKIKPVGDIKGANDKNAAHALCWTCHAKQEPDPVKKACVKCHTGK